MKPITKNLFSLFVIFALLFNDFVITTDAIIKQKALFHHINKDLSSSSDSTLKKNELKNKNETKNKMHNNVDYRLKSERKNKISAVVDRTKAYVKELITLLVLSAIALVVAIGFSIGKSYIDSKREKEDEIFKKEVLAQKVKQQIEKEKQNELFIEYCQLFQTLGKLVESNIVLGKFHVQETSESSVSLKKQAPSNALISKVDSIVTQFTNEEKKFTRQTYENCYNAFHYRTAIPDVGGISRDLTFEEDDFVKMKETIIAAKTQVKEAVKVNPSDYLKLAELVEKGNEAYSTVSEIKSKGEENKLGEINSYNPINIEEPAKNFIGDAKIGGQIASGAWSLYKKIVELDEISDTAEKEKLGNARKGLAYVTCGWEMLENVFKTSNSVVGNIGGTSLNIPFTGLVSITLKLISAIANYKVAYSEWSSDKTDLKDLTKNLKFWDMMDAICDLLQELANDLILISPLTAGVSAALGIALKVVFGLIGVFTAWMRLKKSRDIHKKIIAGLEKVTQDQKKNTKSMSEELTKKYCAQMNEILRQYLKQEFSRFEKDLVYKRNLVEEQYDAELARLSRGTNSYQAKVADWNSKIEAANDQVLKVICAYSHDNCLKSYNTLSEHYYYPFGREGYQQYAQSMLGNAVSSIRTGPINSALSVLQGTDKTQSIEFSLMTNGYVPAYQSSTFNIFVCRSCLDTSLLVENLTFTNTDEQYPVSGKTHIQDTIHKRNVVNNVETVQFMNAILGEADTTKKELDYAIVHGASAPELKSFPKSTNFDFYSLVIFSGKTIPNTKIAPLGAISAGVKSFYLIGSYSSDNDGVKQYICKSTTPCSFHIVRVDQGEASRVVENAHSSSVSVRSEDYDHSSHINEKGYLYTFREGSEDDSFLTKTGWKAINSENILFDGSNFKVYRKKIHDVSSIMTREYDIDPKNIWNGIKTLEKLGSREILKLTKKVYCENCKVAFPNTIYGQVEFNNFDICSNSESKWGTSFNSIVQKSFEEQKCRAEEKTLTEKEKTKRQLARKTYICTNAQEFWTNTVNLFVSGTSSLNCDSFTEVCT